ncbi:unnamed protein product [Rhizoctonia solani]|uniref:Nephrocystin 3-like N-terminal domain-containing protein n=1 Tax=Rhizoctonia solani TaxID=456999 RepID=A0A8H3B9A9_9AGAM|nr:unnamed protein product [Rhizoctonia solani]
MSTSPGNPPTVDIAGDSKRTSKLKDATKAAGSKLKGAFKAMSLTAGLVPQLGSALDDMSEFVGILEDIVDDDEDLGKVFDEFQRRTDALQNHITKIVGVGGNNATSLIVNSINNHMRYVKERRDKGRIRGGDAVKRAQKIEALLKRLHDDIELKTWENIAEQFTETQLARLHPVLEATYNSSYARVIQRGSCTSGTRQDLLTMLQDWARPGDTEPDDPQPQPKVFRVINQNTAKVFWMSGMAGTGKTTIAYSLCEWLEANAQLGASFFCSRTSTMCQDIDKIIPTIAHQLGRFSPAYRSALCKSLHENPDVATRDIQVQFEKLIVNPLEVIKATIPNGVVVIVDALDECADGYGAQTILDLLLIHADDLPIRFFITSRPEPSIREKMLPLAGPLSSVFHLHDIDASIVNDDIKKYLTDALKHLTPCPTNDQILRLANKAGRLFIYASTLVRYISPRGVRVHSKSRLDKILETNMQPLQTEGSQLGGLYKELDQLYRTVLELAFAEALEVQELTIMQGVLQTVVCAKEPLAIETLSVLLGVPEEYISYSLGSLHSVLHVPEEGGCVSTLHASFPDFLLNQSRTGAKHHCNKAQRDEILARSCLEIMKQQLRFNICNLESSFLPDSRVPGLKERISKLPPALFYACRFWGDHLQAICIPRSGYFYDALCDFFSARLLFWMEMLNLNMSIGAGVQTLSQLQPWMQVSHIICYSFWLFTVKQKNNLSPELQVQLRDARVFLLQFGANSCSSSTPHIYISALPLCPRSSSVYKNYSKNMCGLIAQGTESATAEKVVVLREKAMVLSMALSLDGTRMVSGSSNGIVQIWDVYTCTKVGRPLSGHSDSVLSVTISPNGAYVVSGSSDKTIHIWNACDGTPHGKPLEGHTDSVNSVVILPTNPTLLASGSSDKTIRLWDLQSGNVFGLPLIHTDSVNSVAFSSTPTRLVSGSFDGTIRIWDPLSGTLLGRPIIGHSGSVTSVAISLDGTCIVSGSYDLTIRVWDADSGTLIGQPLNGHTAWVKSVAFTPDCARIVSGSFDRTVRVWDVQTGKQIGQPYKGHTGWVFSASFTPEGTYIVSSSSDKTIRFWDTYHDTVIDRCAEEYSKPGTEDALRKGTESDPWDIQRSKKFDLEPPGRPYEPPDLNSLIKADGELVDQISWESLSRPGVVTEEFKPTRLVNDSRRVIMKDNAVFVWLRGSRSYYAKIEPDEGQIQEILSVAFSPDRVRIVVGLDWTLKTAQMWEVSTPMQPEVLSQTWEHGGEMDHPPEAKGHIRGPITLTGDGWLRLLDKPLERAYQLRRETDEFQKKVNVLHREIGELKKEMYHFERTKRFLGDADGSTRRANSSQRAGSLRKRKCSEKYELQRKIIMLQEEMARLPREMEIVDGSPRDADESLDPYSWSLLFWFPRALHRQILLLDPPHLFLAVGDAVFGTSPYNPTLAIGEQWSKCYVR